MELPKYRMKGFDISFQELKEQAPNCLRSSLIGTGVGFLPGIGAGIASLLSYTTAKENSKKSDQFGTGILDGIVASESANNAVSGGALIPLLTMGIPGDASTTLLLAAFMMHGITCGPMLFVSDSKLVYTMFAFLAIGNIAMVLVMYYLMPLFLKLLRIPKHILLSIVMVLCCIGAFGINNRMFDVWGILVMSVICFVMRIFDYPAPPLIMGFILGNIVESNLTRAFMYTNGSVVPFFTHPISAVFLTISAVYIILFIRKSRKKETSKARF